MFVIQDYDIQNRFMSITLDNASANSKAIKYFINSNITNIVGKFFHARCACHIINLIVKSGLKKVESQIDNIRGALGWIMASNQRIAEFVRFCESKNLKPRFQNSLDNKEHARLLFIPQYGQLAQTVAHMVLCSLRSCVVETALDTCPGQRYNRGCERCHDWTSPLDTPWALVDGVRSTWNNAGVDDVTRTQRILLIDPKEKSWKVLLYEESLRKSSLMKHTTFEQSGTQFIEPITTIERAFTAVTMLSLRPLLSPKDALKKQLSRLEERKEKRIALQSQLFFMKDIKSLSKKVSTLTSSNTKLKKEVEKTNFDLERFAKESSEKLTKAEEEIARLRVALEASEKKLSYTDDTFTDALEKLDNVDDEAVIQIRGELMHQYLLGEIDSWRTKKDIKIWEQLNELE
ncbi:hypothetical protein Ddye_021465 [Dipteronia dyeriana]|uniref:Uncharacterized protein n=1 Tax=Dipteronia dyeriana TaxID=168575 RepID=A0AAD9U2Q6_9ROSI|nr:hypothetical protein Ddye_021465 [Dipteronia dyeriana]